METLQTSALWHGLSPVSQSVDPKKPQGPHPNPTPAQPSPARTEVCVGRAPAGSPLIEQDDPIHSRVEVAPVALVAAAAGPAVQEHDRLPLRIATLLVVKCVDF